MGAETAAANTLLFVDDEKNILNSLARVFRREGYNVLTAEGPEPGLDIVGRTPVSLVVSDFRMPGMDGVEFLSRVKAVSPETMRFILTGYADTKAVMGAINKGEVYRYVTKPWDDAELKAAVREAVGLYNLSRENRRLSDLTKRQNRELTELNLALEAKVAEKTGRIRENFFAFVRIFADVIELFDQNVGGHSKRVAAMSGRLAEAMGLSAEECEHVRVAALLHSIGLIGMPREIIDKDEELTTDRERALLRHAPALSQDILAGIETLKPVGAVIRGIMERYDGDGWPDGLREREIPAGARVIAVCKLYDKLVARKGLKLYDAVCRMREEGGKSLDPSVVAAFVNSLGSMREADSDLQHVAAVPGLDTVNDKLRLTELKSGMVLARNLLTSKGRLLAAKGTVLTDAMIEKVRAFHFIDPILDYVQIVPASVPARDAGAA